MIYTLIENSANLGVNVGASSPSPFIYLALYTRTTGKDLYQKRTVSFSYFFSSSNMESKGIFVLKEEEIQTIMERMMNEINKEKIYIRYKNYMLNR